jgi:hypothetical protein
MIERAPVEDIPAFISPVHILSSSALRVWKDRLKFMIADIYPPWYIDDVERGWTYSVARASGVVDIRVHGLAPMSLA